MMTLFFLPPPLFWVGGGSSSFCVRGLGGDGAEMEGRETVQRCSGAVDADGDGDAAAKTEMSTEMSTCWIHN